MRRESMKLHGIKAVCSESKYLDRYGYGLWMEIFVNQRTGHVWGSLEASQTWTSYEDKDILRVGWIRTPHTMEQIRDLVEGAIEYDAECEEAHAAWKAAFDQDTANQYHYPKW